MLIINVVNKHKLVAFVLRFNRVLKKYISFECAQCKRVFLTAVQVFTSLYPSKLQISWKIRDTASLSSRLVDNIQQQ